MFKFEVNYVLINNYIMIYDEDLIYEAYITADWDYTNIDYPNNSKYGNIPTSKTSYYQKGHCPASPGQASTYTVSQEDEEIEKIEEFDKNKNLNNNSVYIKIGNIGAKSNTFDNNVLFVSIPIPIDDKYDEPQLKSIIKKMITKGLKDSSYYIGTYAMNEFCNRELNYEMPESGNMVIDYNKIYLNGKPKPSVNKNKNENIQQSNNVTPNTQQPPTQMEFNF